MNEFNVRIVIQLREKYVRIHKKRKNGEMCIDQLLLLMRES